MTQHELNLTLDQKSLAPLVDIRYELDRPYGSARLEPERRLRHVAFVRREREVADRRQRQKVIEPGEVYERCFVGIKSKKISIGQQPRQWRSFTSINPKRSIQ